MDSIKAVFFDLDGTLLDSNMDVFLTHYLKRLAARTAHLIPPDEFIHHLLAATEAMVANDGRATNAEVFIEAFYPCVGYDLAELEPIFMDFYANDYPALREFTRRRPEARPAVQLAFDRGYDVVIATAPLFPETAVRQRMAWAGVDDFPFRRITSYENSRFCKPNVRYFQEIADFLGYPPEACLVVGDDSVDMVAAHIGCSTFLVPGAAPKPEIAAPEPAYRGTLQDLMEIL